MSADSMSDRARALLQRIDRSPELRADFAAVFGVLAHPSEVAIDALNPRALELLNSFLVADARRMPDDQRGFR